MTILCTLIVDTLHKGVLTEIKDKLGSLLINVDCSIIFNACGV